MTSTATTSPSRVPADPREVYRARATDFDREAVEKQSSVNRFARARLVLFLLTAFLTWTVLGWGWGAPAVAALVAMTLLFVVMVRRHRRARLRLRRVEIMAEVNREAVARVDRDWSGIPEPPAFDVAGNHDYAKDLDLAGYASLLHLVGTCGTAPGWKTLWGWLQGPAGAEDLRRRQEAAAELADDLDFRDAVSAEARLVDEGLGKGLDGFLAWAEGVPSEVGRRRWLYWAARLLAVINVVFLVLRVLEVIPTAPLAWSLLISTAVVAPYVRSMHRFFAQAEGNEAGVREYGPLMALLGDASLESTWGREARERLTSGDRAAADEIDALRRLLDLAEVRRSPLFHGPLLLILLWDVHVLRGLEAWRRRSGSHVRDWLAVLGEAEALTALGGLAHQNPEWVDAAVDGTSDRIRGRSLAHPLIPPDVRVANDVEVGPAGSFLLVTGSNMSGKSTLLRAIGLNAVLGQAGGRVCARGFSIPPARVVTSMRVDDSLAGGVSFFMAELRRLKHVVDVAESEKGGRCVFLLDEILQGTNSAERRVAARSVVRQLVAAGAIGAVTTHDLSLAGTPDLERIAVPVHFTETVGGGGEGLTFDYRLRPGIAQSTNALKLLKLVGLGDGE